MKSELESSEEKLKILFEYAPDAYYLNDLRGTFVDGNIAAEELTGYSRSELIGKSFLKLNLLSRKYILKAAKLLTFNALGKSTGPDEFILTRKDGTKVQVEIRTFPVKINNQTLVLGIARDITERKKREKVILQQNEFLNKVIESLAHPFYVIDATDYTIQLANSATGFGNLRELTCYELTHKREVPCASSELICPLEEVKKTKKPVEVEHIHYDKDGNIRTFMVYAYPILDDAGNVIQMIEYSLDITKHKKMEEMLRDATEKWISLTENTDDTIVVTDNQNIIRYINKTIPPTTPEGVIGTSVFEYVAKEHHDVMRKSLKKVYKTGEPDSYEVTLDMSAINPELGTLWFSTKLVPIKTDKEISGIIMTATDITERKKMETIMRMLSTAVRTSVDAIIVASPVDGKLLFCNEAFLKMWKVEGNYQDIVYSNCFDNPPDILMKAVEATMKGNWTGELTAKRMNGKTFPVLVASSPIVEENGKVVGLLGIFKDITDRKKMVKKIEDLAKFPSENPDPIMRIDKNGVLLYANNVSKSFVEKWKSGIGKPIPKEWIQYVNSVLTSSLNEYIVLEHDNRVYSFLFTPVGSTYVNVYGRDITELKIIEEELIYYNENLEELVEEKTEKLQKAQRMATIGETAAMVGHDLRNPLQAMVNITYLIGKKLEAMPPPLQKMMEKGGINKLKQTLEDQIKYMNKIVSDLQNYARTINLKPVKINLEQLIRNILPTITIPPIIEVSMKIPENLIIIVDPAYMKRVFINLITNAVQAMPNGGALRIIASKTASEVLIRVEDTGVGIPEKNLPKLFQPLFTTKAQGQGFGLPVCKRIVEAHNGEITVESEVEEGSTFTIKLPL